MQYPGPWTVGRLQELFKPSSKSEALATSGRGHAVDSRTVKTAAVCPTEGDAGAARSEETQRMKRQRTEGRGMDAGGSYGLARSSGPVSKSVRSDSDDDGDDDREEEDDYFDGGDSVEGGGDASDEVSVDLDLVDDVTCDEGFELGEVSTVRRVRARCLFFSPIFAFDLVLALLVVRCGVRCPRSVAFSRGCSRDLPLGRF